MLHIRVVGAKVETIPTQPKEAAILRILKSLRPLCSNRRKYIIRVGGSVISEGYTSNNGDVFLPSAVSRNIQLPENGISAKRHKKADGMVKRETVAAAVNGLFQRTKEETIKMKRLRLLYVPSIGKEIDVKSNTGNKFRSILKSVSSDKCTFQNGQDIVFNEIALFTEVKQKVKREEKREKKVKRKLVKWSGNGKEEILPTRGAWTPDEMFKANQKLGVGPTDFDIELYQSVDSRGITERHI